MENWGWINEIQGRRMENWGFRIHSKKATNLKLSKIQFQFQFELSLPSSASIRIILYVNFVLSNFWCWDVQTSVRGRGYKFILIVQTFCVPPNCPKLWWLQGGMDVKIMDAQNGLAPPSQPIKVFFTILFYGLPYLTWFVDGLIGWNWG